MLMVCNNGIFYMAYAVYDVKEGGSKVVCNSYFQYRVVRLLINNDWKIICTRLVLFILAFVVLSCLS